MSDFIDVPSPEELFESSVSDPEFVAEKTSSEGSEEEQVSFEIMI